MFQLRREVSERFGVWVQRLLVVVLHLWHRSSMSFVHGRKEAFKWIKRRLTRRRSHRPGSENRESGLLDWRCRLFPGTHIICMWISIFMTGDDSTMAYVIWKIFMKQYARLRYDPQPLSPKLIWHSYAAIQTADTNIEAGRAEAAVSGSGAGAGAGAGAELAEILVPNDTQIAVPVAGGIAGGQIPSLESQSPTLTTDMDTKEARAAPIARDEEDPEVEDPEEGRQEVEQLSANANYVCCRYPGTSSAATATLNRSKSRVQKYLKKCKQRLTGQLKIPTGNTTTTTTITLVRNEPAPTAIEERESEKELEDDLVEEEDLVEGSTGSYTDALPIDCSLSASIAEEQQQAVDELEPPKEEVPLETETCPDGSGIPMPIPRRLAAEVDATLARLIDSHLSHIYPVYWARTRAILIQQARERLVCGFDGSLARFEQRFLCKFAEIATALRTAHQIGEFALVSSAREKLLGNCVEKSLRKLGNHREAIIRR
ncbi:hypothetical protein M5D96_006231 [Drosophila gunungcola]|uniref:Uncharacterized protein n=1 Tax=Drosophila gunungcola TaxID=103775 RepID=A0A9P9YNQ9_9MUSC|nr:hypothetical protein M5D96_006231 [Drosophila gunungcola]